MVAKIIETKELRGKREFSLVDSIPLPTPWTVFVDPTNACNLRCSYCPTGHKELLKSVGRTTKHMDWDTFQNVAFQLTQFPNEFKRIQFYKDGEPLLNPRIFDMIKTIDLMQISESLWIKTNGIMLQYPGFVHGITHCGLDMIGISVQAVSSEGYLNVAGIATDYEEYRNGIKNLFEHRTCPVSIKIADINLTPEEKQKFLDDFSDYCDFISIEGLHGWSDSDTYDFKLGTNRDFDGTERRDKIACPSPFYMLAINSNGDVSSCNDDWGHWHGLGNVNEDTLYNIWYGEKLKEFRLDHLCNRRNKNRACRNCDYLAALPDSIDDSLEIIKENLDKYS